MNTRRHVDFVHMKDGTREDYAFLHGIETAYHAALPDRLLAAMRKLGDPDSIQGYRVSRLEHCLQTATRAERDGADIDFIVAALLHDVGDELATANHSQLAAAIVEPYVRAEVTWVVKMHGLFQMQFYAHHHGQDPSGHLAHREHPWFDVCQHFCEDWDQPSFDPAYPTLPLAHFEPLLRAVFAREPFGSAATTQVG